jgi:hypothetical protein
MQRQAIDLIGGDFHHRLGPAIIIDIGAAGDLDDARTCGGLDESGIAAGFIGRKFGAHIAATTP